MPLVYHRTVKLSPLAIAVSVAAGAEIGGILGALLGIPAAAAAALKVASREVLAWGEHRPRRNRQTAADVLPATDQHHG